MSHLIQPITIDDTKYCLKHGDPYARAEFPFDAFPNWRTVGLLSGPEITANGAEDDDLWTFVSNVNANGHLKFAVSCLSEIQIYLALIDPTPLDISNSVDCEVFVNGVFNTATTLYGDSGNNEGGVIIHLDESPCGSVLEIYFSATADVWLYIEIFSIS